MTTAQLWKEGHQQHNADRSARLQSALKCLKLIRPLVSFDNVIDFGCGIGAWLLAAEALGAKRIIGIEGEWITTTDTMISKENILIRDLSHEWPKFTKEFDLAITIEVVEHLPESAADDFCQSLVSASNYILFSAAVPRQGGIGHINEQPLPYWVSKFWKLGFVPLEPVRPYIARDASIFPWLRSNVVMFVNYDMVIRSDCLLKFARPIDDFRLSYQPIP